MGYTVVVNRSEIDYAFGLLSQVLRINATVVQRRIGHRGGGGKRRLLWHSTHGFWVCMRPHLFHSRFWIALGTANPLANESLGITCEINPPKSRFSRKCGGVFLNDGKDVLFGHTGKLAGGRQGIGKEAFLVWHQKRSHAREMHWPDGKVTPVIVIGRLTKPDFLCRLADFVHNVERFKIWVRGETIDEQLTQDSEKAETEGEFDLEDLHSTRSKVLRSVNLRRGQPTFRQKLIRAYAGRCAISDCDCVDALDAAHIQPYRSEASNHVQNGLLLRSDLHTLFDLGKIGVDSTTYRIIVADSLRETSYGRLHGKRMNLPKSVALRPSRVTLADHQQTWNL